MNQSKLTFKEIIDVFKNNNVKVEQFVYDYDLSYSIDACPEAKEAYETRKSFKTSYLSDLKALDYKEKHAEYIKLPDPYKIAVNYYKENVLKLNWEEVAQEGGEGEGDIWYSVKYFPDHDVYIRIDGFYQSYIGVEFYNGWDCCSEVRPKEKTITVYE